MLNPIRNKFIWLIFGIAIMAVLNLYAFDRPLYAADEDDTKKSIQKTQEQIDKEKKELEKSQSELQVTQSQIQTTAGLLNKTQSEIKRKEAEVDNLDKRIGLNKNILEEYVREMFISSQSDQMIGLAVSDKLVSEYWADFDQMVSVKQRVLEIMDEINRDKERISKAKEELAEKKEEHEELLVYKQSEKNEIVEDISEAKLTISQLQAKLNKLRSTLSSFLGKSFDMDDVISAVKSAQSKTGVRKEFLFAVLDKETDLGRFTGGCTYKNSKMGDRNEAIFKDVCDGLGYDYKKMKVSCPLSYGIGGAMGVAQFMPTTWAGWSSKISAVTGNKPANPWKLEDGIMGMALKLKAGGAGSKSGEYKAAAMYYCGGNWTRAVCKAYASTVISWSKGYDDYF